MGETPLAPAKDDSPTERMSRDFTRVLPSKKYVLPPRPKPGRKPKNLKPDLRPIKPAVVPTPSTPIIVDKSDDCGLCTRQDCVCKDIGIKNTETEIDFGHFSPQAAIPLKRKEPPRTEQKARSKFKKASVSDLLSPVVTKPTFEVKMNPGNSCGFCTADTPCLCAGDLDERKPSSDQGSIDQPSSEHQSLSPERVDYGCDICQQDPMSMLFCLSLSAAKPLPSGAVSIPCSMAYRTIVKHPKFSECDLGEVVTMLECSNKMIGIQSINRVLQHLNKINPP